MKIVLSFNKLHYLGIVSFKHWLLGIWIDMIR